MLYDYLVRPDDHMLHPKRFSNSTIMSIVWGVRTPTPQTRHMERLYALMEIWSKVMETGATPPVDIYPLLHYLPQSIFLNWVDRATHVQKEMNHLYSDFLRDIRHRRSTVGSRGAFMDKVLESADSEKRMDGLTYSDHELWFMGGTLTEGGSDTTASIVTAFMQAMVAYPDVQRKAQAEIDAVIGPDRSPTWQDYKRLPYVAQCVKETMRSRPVTPLAFPHALAEDDWVDGMFLPKVRMCIACPRSQRNDCRCLHGIMIQGTVIIVNAWGLHNDPKRFPSPEHFDPDHFKDMTTPAPELANGRYESRDHYGYGTGRRFCPGAHLAERNLFLAMSKLLWAFNIGPGKNGVPDTSPVTGYCEGFLVCANDFDASFDIRGGRAENDSEGA
ncbi:Cytochrome P450 monooxygenase patH [Fulvia fulva]|nr:Cytochrome P450 monooxygenase patH [Fulvia fulva]